MKQEKLNHIELFAGCGGLSLGLETSGFDLIFANELSPMAAETFAYNHLNVDLAKSPADKVLWLSSEFNRNELSKRLREPPFSASGIEEKHSDVNCTDLTSLDRHLLVGSINDLNTLAANKGTSFHKLIQQLEKNVDLVSGGPPCQSFSLAGLRDHSNSRNQLPWEFAKFVGTVKPKIALLENVSGILRAFNKDGKSYYAWYEVAKAFASLNYVPICLHINAKYIGAAQNRPRFIMLSLRYDIARKLLGNNVDDQFSIGLLQSIAFTDKVFRGKAVSLDDLSVHDIEKNPALFDSPLFSHLATMLGKESSTVKDAIDDLLHESKSPSAYVNLLNSAYENRYNMPVDKLINHELRNNSPHVKARFKLYQIVSMLPRAESIEIVKFIKNPIDSVLSESTIKALSKRKLLTPTGEMVSLKKRGDIEGLIASLHSKKQTQRALIANKPAPAALSIPDDACHYDEKTIRTLTVREMARIQTFPDWFQIRSKVTTGGKMRKFEVPQYTQVGNAVPPLLGVALGKVCREIIAAAR